MKSFNCSTTVSLNRSGCARADRQGLIARVSPVGCSRTRTRLTRPFIHAKLGLRVSAAARIPNLFTNMFKSGGKAQNAQKVKALNFQDNAPSWDLLTDLAKAKQAEFGVNFWSDPEQGPTNPLALKRTFGKSGPIRVKLYRDHAAWCPYCQKVWFELEEKQIPYTMEKINMRCYGDKPKEFLAKVPSGLLPVLELDGRVITESAVIMNILDETFPEIPLMPKKGTPERARADQLMRLERRFFSDWLNWLCSDYNHDRAKAGFVACLDTIEEELQAAGGPFFCGEQLTLVDITFTPMLERAVASIAYYKGMFLRGTGQWPALERWFAALEARPTYIGTKSDFYTHCHDLPPQLGGCAMHGEGEVVSAQIDGTDGVHWKLPLPPLSTTSLPEPYSLGDNPALDTLEAASKLVRNHQAVVKFALRGPGLPGPRPVSAPLADPTGVPALEHMAAGDAALRHVVHALLVGVEAKQASPQALQVQPSGGVAGAPVILAAEYLRDRVGVPRDMKFPAARQLRAHLNWLIDSLAAA